MANIGFWFGVAVLTFMLGGMFWARVREKEDWNGGVCTACPGSRVVHFDTSSQGCRGYRCNECQRRFWISYRVDK